MLHIENNFSLDTNLLVVVLKGYSLITPSSFQLSSGVIYFNEKYLGMKIFYYVCTLLKYFRRFKLGYNNNSAYYLGFKAASSLID